MKSLKGKSTPSTGLSSKWASTLLPPPHHTISLHAPHRHTFLQGVMKPCPELGSGKNLLNPTCCHRRLSHALKEPSGSIEIDDKHVAFARVHRMYLGGDMFVCL